MFGTNLKIQSLATKMNNLEFLQTCYLIVELLLLEQRPTVYSGSKMEAGSVNFIIYIYISNNKTVLNLIPPLHIHIHIHIHDTYC